MKKRKEEIRIAAKRLFLSQGMEKTTMSAIAKNISIARTTIYEYYSSKEEILYDLLEEIIVEDNHFNEINQTITAFDLKLIEITKFIFRRLKSNFQTYKLFYQEVPTLKDKTKDKLSKWQEVATKSARNAIQEAIGQGLIREDLDFEQHVFYYQALVGQKMSLFLMSEKEFDATKEAKEVIDILLNGIGVKKNGN